MKFNQLQKIIQYQLFIYDAAVAAVHAKFCDCF